MIIRDFFENGINVTWTLLLICFESCNLLKYCEYGKRFISASEIIDYAIELLETSDETSIISLAILKETEEEDILKLLQQLSVHENLDYSIEYKKFRAMYILKNLPKSNDEVLQGSLKIYELWDMFDFSDDLPDINLDFKKISLKKYLELLDIHNEWIQNEFNSIRG